MVKQHQPPSSLEEQIENLKRLGLTIENEEEAKKFLNEVSYFRLIKAYGYGFKQERPDYYRGVTFNQIKGLYLFNAKFRHLLFAELEKVEVNFRCRIANYFSCKYGVLGYLQSENFKKKEYHQAFLIEIEKEISRNRKADFVRNFQNNYEEGRLPFYALIELFSFGMLSKFFKNMKNSDKKAVAAGYGVNYKYLESWIEHLAFVRNICAHYGRFYNVNLAITPILFEDYTKRDISNLRVYASLVCLKHLLTNKEHWVKFVGKIGLLFDDFPCVEGKKMGFPEFWGEYLLKEIEEFPFN